ncbi:hypothetical protein [Uliginosibacterium aquaticum]|uniref:Ferritin-like metal-binding protein YciE n=1 Tax=Uliginosibacterium aquaticum TaxID=2731212 RepID=A0ABX2IE47_9RHOO|nr:hypothetical protein [Uliginosibacterium aquaticum]NSL54904.1 hypothetical protein [Uliginosibacterium aquaticum]
MSEHARFLANMILLEEETARHCKRLADVALAAGDEELEAFFLSVVESAHLDIADALAEGAERRHATLEVRPISECLLSLPGRQPRSGHAALLGVHCAMACALSLVRRSHAYYASIAVMAEDARLRQRAAGFEREHSAHIGAMEHWINRLTT